MICKSGSIWDETYLAMYITLLKKRNNHCLSGTIYLSAATFYDSKNFQEGDDRIQITYLPVLVINSDVYENIVTKLFFLSASEKMFYYKEILALILMDYNISCWRFNFYY